MTHNFEKLLVWQGALVFIKMVYTMCSHLPRNEEHVLIDQIKRSSTSIALNIAEGSAAQSNIEYKRFLYISKKSQIESIAILKIITELYSIDTHQEVQKAEEIGKMLHGLVKYLKEGASTP
jgi:four helix bundle protein